MVYLWPYAMRVANESVNNSPNMQDNFKRSPTDIMFNTYVQTNIKHWYPFACPVYVFNNKLQDEKRIHNKWESRSRVGIYLGHSPLQARSIALILNLGTGLVSPYFHVQFDKTFETIEKNPPHHGWLAMVGFKSDKHSAVTPTSQDDSAPKNKKGWKDGGDKPGESQGAASFDTVPQRMHPNNENDSKISKNKNKIEMNRSHQLQPAEAATADPSKPGGGEVSMLHGEEIQSSLYIKP